MIIYEKPCEIIQSNIIVEYFHLMVLFYIELDVIMFTRRTKQQEIQYNIKCDTITPQNMTQTLLQ